MKTNEWTPSGVEDLEPNALKAVQSLSNQFVVAGPGAGKTELLAQRAAYLLQTGECRFPQRILAISFKRDAAKNLADRVAERVGPELAYRFTSHTFEAFAKGLLDRFRAILPEHLSPHPQYSVTFRNASYVGRFLTYTAQNAPQQWRHQIAAIPALNFESKLVGAFRLPSDHLVPTNAKEYAIQTWIKSHIDNSELTFTIINRLAELLQRTNMQLKNALRLSYPFVFIDEFQDTTEAQFDFLASLFAHPNAIVTAVGDDKQRIMGWAGAKPDIFTHFKNVFSGSAISLVRNYRSTDRLVKIQQHVARALDEQVIDMESMVEDAIAGDAAQIWTFKSCQHEFRQIAEFVSTDMADRGTIARDYVILVRQKPEDIEAGLIAAFGGAGLILRNESRLIGRLTIQDLLAEPLADLVTALFKLGLKGIDGRSWSIASRGLDLLRNSSQSNEGRRWLTENQLQKFIVSLASTLNATSCNAKNAQALVERAIKFLDPSSLKQNYSRYSAGDALEVAIESLSQYLTELATSSNSWSEMLDKFDGVHTVPLMTVHKSKGLEFDTVIFVGLDDSSWWSHTPGSPDGTATFYVALTRAKQRVLFSYCSQNGNRNKVADLFSHLKAAGVQEVSF